MSIPVKPRDHQPQPTQKYVVWNKNRNEGFVTDSLQDANHAAGIKKMRNFYSSIGDAFREAYADEGKLKVEKVML